MKREMSRWTCRWGFRFLRPGARFFTPEEREKMERFRREIIQPAPRFFTKEELEKMARTEGAYQYRGDAK